MSAPAVISSPTRYGTPLAKLTGDVELSPSLRADLLDLDAWGEILAVYGRSMKVAVALTDSHGQRLGECHNAQPVWKLLHDATPGLRAGCPFCITTTPCTAVARALQTGGTVMVHDQAGLTHVAVPLLLGGEHLGAIVAGQVFDQYPDPLVLRRVAKEFGLPAQQLWDVARVQRPVSSSSLQASGDLLCALGRAFLRERYGAILEAKLAQTNARFRLLVDGVKDHALFTMDPTGVVTSWNGGGEHLLAYGEDEIVGQNFSCIFTAEDIQNGVPEKLLQTALEMGLANDEGWRVRGNQKQFWGTVNITALLEDAGTVASFALIVQDKTERKKIAIALEEAGQERERVQEKILSGVSHELRTPLTAIYLFTTNLLDGLFGDLTPVQHEHLTLALENVRQLKSMVSDLLDITRAKTYKLNIESEHVDPARVIGEVLATCHMYAAAKNISLSSVVATDLPFVWADPARMRQILVNLIDNGIKFTPENGTVVVKNQPFAEKDEFLCLSVCDTGCGISSENFDIVFDRLMQVKGYTPGSRSGLGLGLNISKDLVTQHGGHIWVESQLGEGSTFFFTLPVFSLAKLCARVFNASDPEGGSVTIIAVDVAAVKGGIQANILPEIRRVLESCIDPRQDVLLPSMYETQSSETFFIVASTDTSGFSVIAGRISRELQKFDSDSKLKPIISPTTLMWAPGQSREKQISEVTERIEKVIQAHFMARGKLQ
jgi:PAS domain S-box-containing protein